MQHSYVFQHLAIYWECYSVFNFDLVKLRLVYIFQFTAQQPRLFIIKASRNPPFFWKTPRVILFINICKPQSTDVTLKNQIFHHTLFYWPRIIAILLLTFFCSPNSNFWNPQLSCPILLLPLTSVYAGSSALCTISVRRCHCSLFC